MTNLKMDVPEAACAALREIKPFVLRELPGLLDRFYTLVAADGEAAAFFDGSEAMDRAKRAQLAHWERLFDGRFDDTYLASARGIGLAHQRIGLPLRLYLAAYGFILGELLAVVARARTGTFGLGGADRLIAAQGAVVQGLFVDMEIAVSVYMAKTEEVRLQIADGMVANIDQQATDVIGSIGHITDDLDSTVRELEDAVAAMRGSADQATGVSQQALEAAGSVRTAAGQLHGSIQEISGQTARTAGIARDAVSEITQAKDIVDQLGAKAKEIGGILTLIQEIASQTNLLALNATIEAARAGAAGKGFAVVANEVKGLATQSQKATEEIADRIQRIQETVSSTVEVIGHITGTVRSMEEASSSIAAAVEQQAAATDEIARAISVATDAAQEVSRLMEGVSEDTTRANCTAQVVSESSHRMREALGDLPRTLCRVVRTSSTLTDRRQVRRLPSLVEVKLHLGGRAQDGLMRDVSTIGAYVECPNHGLAEGLEGEIEITARGVRVAVHVVATVDKGLHLTFVEANLPAPLVKELAVESAGKLVEMAKGDHLAFVARVAKVIEGGEQVRSSELSTHHTCRMGRWYDGINDPATLQLPAFLNLAEPHRVVHTTARNALLALEGGDRDLAERHFGGTKRASEQVVAGLERFHKEFLVSIEA